MPRLDLSAPRGCKVPVSRGLWTRRYGEGLRMGALRFALVVSLCLGLLTAETAHAYGDWDSTFEGGNFSEWSTWGAHDSRYAGHDAVTAQEAGIPPLAGDYVAEFSVDRQQVDRGSIHSKLMKEWVLPSVTKRDDSSRAIGRLPDDSPAGTYRASFFFPSDYRRELTRPYNEWTNIFQFKQGYREAGAYKQDPQFWIDVSAAGQHAHAPSGLDTDTPVLHVNNWRTDYDNYRPSLYTVPLGRWFEIRADLYPGDRIEWYVDGEHFETSFSTSSKKIGFSEPQAEGWVFGIGHYDGIGRLWADGAAFTPR